MKVLFKILTVILCIFNVSLHAGNIKKERTKSQQAVSDQMLLKQSDALYQMWALSRSYQFGTSVDKNPIRSLAWQMVYLDALPKSYPGKKTSLLSYKQGLSAKEIAKAKQQAKVLRTKYRLDFHLSESNLSHIFAIKNLMKETMGTEEKKQKTGFVGQIKSSKDLKLTNILLRSIQGNTTQNPWDTPIFPITVLSDGKFYAKGLKASNYELIISLNNGKTIHKQLNLSPGKIKGLASIDLAHSSGNYA